MAGFATHELTGLKIFTCSKSQGMVWYGRSVQLSWDLTVVGCARPFPVAPPPPSPSLVLFLLLLFVVVFVLFSCYRLCGYARSGWIFNHKRHLIAFEQSKTTNIFSTRTTWNMTTEIWPGKRFDLVFFPSGTRECLFMESPAIKWRIPFELASLFLGDLNFGFGVQTRLDLGLKEENY